MTEIAVEWEQLADKVWLLRGIPPGGTFGVSETVFTIVVVAEGSSAVLKAGERLDSLEKTRALAKALRSRGFRAARAVRHGVERCYQ